MTNPCKWCRGDGLIFVYDRFDDGIASGYHLAACSCPKGQWWRTKHQLKAKAATLDPKPLSIGRLEEYFSAAELKTLTTTYDWFDPR